MKFVAESSDLHLRTFERSFMDKFLSKAIERAKYINKIMLEKYGIWDHSKIIDYYEVITTHD